MTDILSPPYRTHSAGDLRRDEIGSEVRLAGWVHRSRDLGGLVFFDLRDRSGRAQVSFDPAWADDDVLARARGLSPEDVVVVAGLVERRPGDNVNPDMPTGEVEVRATALRVVSRAEALPIPVARTPEEELPAEDLRLRYRYLDLRRPELQRNFLIRHRAAAAARTYLGEQGFVEIETPMLTRRTPEGARDYLVPSRLHAGEFYALPQSPQLYKQLLMVSGFERYFQIARCLRDEDLRADRQPEFTQIDAEMSFADEDEVFRVGEGLVAAIWRAVLDIELPLPFPRLSYAEAVSRYGTDKPDLRYDLPIVDLTEILATSDFRVFQAVRGTDQRIRGIRAPGGEALSRREIESLQDAARRGGALGVLWIKATEDGFSGPFAKAIDEAVATHLREDAGIHPGDLLAVVVGRFRDAATSEGEGDPLLDAAVGEVRRRLAELLGLIDRGKHAWLWVTDFPLFEADLETGELISSHHPFTMPHGEDVARLVEATADGSRISPEKIGALLDPPLRSRAYDAVYNGNELASGSVRIHDAELQRRIFRVLGIEPEEAREKFGFLLEAFRYGAPPHAGFAFGFDRMVMLLAGSTNIRDVIAFPKTTSARASFEGAPSPIPDHELRDLHLKLRSDEPTGAVAAPAGESAS